MGIVDSVTFTLVSSTPYTLQYLMVDTGQPGPTVLRNNLGVTPDMGTDALQAALEGGHLPLSEILKTVCTNVAEARHLLLGDGTVAGPDIASRYRCQVTVTQRSLPAAPKSWSVDAQLDPAAPIGGGRAALNITPPGDGVATAYLLIEQVHTIDA